jgi:hypothetical protein
VQIIDGIINELVSDTTGYLDAWPANSDAIRSLLYECTQQRAGFVAEKGRTSALLASETELLSCVRPSRKLRCS